MICNSKCRVREVRPEELMKVYNIELKSFTYPYPYQLFMIYYKLSPDLFIIAECDKVIVGYAIGIMEHGNVGHVVSIAVDPKFRGQGIGKLLMSELESRLKSRGARRIRLEVSVRNEVAIKLYRSLNYRVVSVIKNYYPDGSDAYIMVKDITQ